MNAHRFAFVGSLALLAGTLALADGGGSPFLSQEGAGLSTGTETVADTSDESQVDFPFAANARCDVMQTGYVDITDLVLVLDSFGLIGDGLAADVNSDGIVDGMDIGEILANFGQIPQYWSAFSVEPEEFIDGGDWVAIRGTQRATGQGGSFEAPFPPDAVQRRQGHAWGVLRRQRQGEGRPRVERLSRGPSASERTC